MKVKFQPSYSSTYLMEMDDAVMIVNLLTKAEIFDGYGDNEKLIPNKQQMSIQTITEDEIKKIQRRQILEPE